MNPLLSRLAGYMQETANAQREAALRSGRPVYDFGIGDPREPTPAFIQKALRDAVADLSEREQSILNLRYGLNGPEEPKSLEEIGRILGITRERVRQLEAEALRELAASADMQPLRAA